jgi:hypothetical protein
MVLTVVVDIVALIHTEIVKYFHGYEVLKLFTNSKLFPLKTWFDAENITGAVEIAEEVGEMEGKPEIDIASKTIDFKRMNLFYFVESLLLTSLLPKNEFAKVQSMKITTNIKELHPSRFLKR